MRPPHNSPNSSTRPPHRTACIPTIACTLLAAGCGGGLELIEAPPEEGVRRAAIVNGQTDDGHPAVGLLKSVTPMGFGICTATLVGSKTVLTAAHCIDDASSSTFEVGGKTYSAASMTPHPSYSKSVLNAHDVAVVVLTQKVTGVQPAPLAKTPPQVGQQITVVGFGVTNSGLTNSGTKRRAHNTISKVNTQYYSYSGASGGEGNVCQGDSGGPAFRNDNGQEVLIGVHSTASVPCGMAGNDMRADYFHSWIEGQAGGDLGADTEAPTVAITEPASGATFDVGDLTVKVTASDDGSGLDSIKLYIDGNLRETASASPAVFTVSGLAVGQHSLRADASDQAGNTNSMMVTITVQDPQQGPSGTAPNDPPSTNKPPEPGSFGASCSQPNDCDTGLCAADSYTGTSYCTQACGAQNPCPDGSDCIPTSNSSVCAVSNTVGNRAAPGEGGEMLLGSCAVGGIGQATPLVALWPLLGLLLVLRLRRRG